MCFLLELSRTLGEERDQMCTGTSPSLSLGVVQCVWLGGNRGKQQLVAVVHRTLEG